MLNLVLALVLISTAPARVVSNGSEGPPPILQPKTYLSPSGNYELYVDPSRRDGGGGGSYRMSHDGELVWAKELGVTLWDAGVTDQGLTAGLAYSNGYRDRGADGSLHLMILGATGGRVLDEALEREQSRQMHAPPTPTARDLVLQGSQDKMRVRVLQGELPASAAWRTYRLSTGERLEDWVPRFMPQEEDGGQAKPLASRSLPGTELTLIHWRLTEYKRRAEAVFTLTNAAGDHAWRLDRPGEYSVEGDQEASSRLLTRVRQAGAVLGVGPESTFELWFPRDRARVRFAVEREGEAWNVRELERAPYDPDELSSTPHESLRLELLTITPLVPAELLPESPIREVQSIGFTDSGAIELVRGRGSECAYVELDEAGQVVSERRLPDLQPEKGIVRWYDGIGSTWFAAVRDWNADGAFSLYRVDVRTGDSREVQSFACPEVHDLEATADGGFVLLGQTGRSSRRGCLIVADGSDAVRWQLTEKPGSHEHEDQLFAIADLAITRDGNVVVLSTVRDAVQIFSSDGEFVRYVDLGEAWGHEPRYPARVTEDGRTGFCVEDNGKLWRMSLEGELLESWRPMSAREVDHPLRRARFDGDGNLWRVEGDQITSSRSDGSRGLAFGAAPSKNGVEDPGGAWIDREGNICILDKGSSSWHVFDTSGEPQLVLELPQPLKTCERPGARPTLGPDGRRYVPLRDGDDDRGHYVFSAEGEPIEEVQLGTYLAQFRGEAPGVWCSAEYGQKLALVRDGQMPSELLRRPDRHWFRDISDFHLSADGTTLAVLDTPRFMTGERGGALCIHDGAGRGRATIELFSTFSLQRVVSSDRWAAISDFGAQVLLVDLQTEEVFQLETDLDATKSWRWGLAPDGGELWGVDVQSLDLYRFALPND
jgi:hypothetical protein